MKFLSMLFAMLAFLLAACVNDSSKDAHEIKVDAFSDYLLYMRSNSTKQGDTLVVQVFASTLPLPIGMGDADTLILYKKGYDLTASLPSHVISASQIISPAAVNYSHVFYASDAHPAVPSCSIDNRGKKFVKDSVYDTSDVFQEHLYDGTKGYYRLIDTVEAVAEFPCSFYLGKGYYMNYSATNIHYYGDIIIKD